MSKSFDEAILGLKVMRLRRDMERVSVFGLTFRICLGLGWLGSTEPSSERSERCEAEETRDASAASFEFRFD